MFYSDCKYKFDSATWHSNQKISNDKCQCESMKRSKRLMLEA